MGQRVLGGTKGVQWDGGCRVVQWMLVRQRVLVGQWVLVEQRVLGRTEGAGGTEGGIEGAGWDRGCWVGQRVLGGTEGAGLSGAVLPQRKTVHILPQVRVRLYGWDRGCWTIWGSATTEKKSSHPASSKTSFIFARK